MRFVRRLFIALVGLVTVSWVPAVPAMAATTMVATIADVQTTESRVRCPDQPGPCTIVNGNRLHFAVRVSNFNSGTAITFGFVVEGITATAGQDFNALGGGTLLINPAPPGNVATGYVLVNLVHDGLAEPTETMRLRLTSSTRPVDISDTGIGSILDGSQLPPDCSATRVDTDTGTMTCTGRPATQQWRLRQECGGWPPELAFGNIVTGNGTSTAHCVSEHPWLMGPIEFIVVA